MSSAISRAANASNNLTNASAAGFPTSTTHPQKAAAVVADIVANAVELMGAVYALRMNKVALKSADAMVGSTLSLQA